MTISRLMILGATALACGLAWGGVRTFGQSGGPGGRVNPEGVAPETEERQAALTRSVDKLQSELDESARRIHGMREELQVIRAHLKAQSAGLRASAASKAATRLADALKRHPARLSQDPGYGAQIYMLDLVEGGITLIADEPAPGLLCCGIPRWSSDGGRILFDAATGPDWPRARLWAIEARDGSPTYTDLGDGNNPAISPDDRRIAFALHASNESGAAGGLFMMNADGSERHRVGDIGAPFWSPHGSRLLVNSFSLPTRSAVLDLETRAEVIVKVPGHQIFSWPSWAGPGMLVSVIAPMEKYEGDSIALLDVSGPGEAKIVEVLWKRGDELDVAPRWPVWRPGTSQYLFVGQEPRSRAIYSVRRGESPRARPIGVVERQGHRRQTYLAGLSFSPDGRYLLFASNRIAQESP